MKRMVIILVVFLLASSARARQQNLIVIKPIIGAVPDLGAKAQAEVKKRDKVLERLNHGVSFDALTPKERELIEKYGESKGIWDVSDEGCSWYCGGGPYKVSASSALKPSERITYGGNNAHDFRFNSAWVEGVPGYGEGEYLEYFFENKSPRVTDIIIYNGYLKSEVAWQKNSRVKRLRLSVNNKPYAFLDLQDTRASQTFNLKEPLGRMTDGKNMVLKFEIVDVYKGDAYDDTAITELFFDGLDVHCLAKGTRITMIEGERPIEVISTGDRIKQYDPVMAQMTSATVTAVVKADHEHLLTLKMEDGSTITTTEDHPFWVAGKGWRARGAQTDHGYVVGDRFLLYNGVKGVREIRLKEVESIEAPATTYTLKLDSGRSFVANGFVTGTENCKKR